MKYIYREKRLEGRGSHIFFFKEVCPSGIFILNMRLGSDLVHDFISSDACPPRAPYLKRKQANYLDS